MEIRLNVGGDCSMEVGMPGGRCPSDDHGHTEAAVIIDRCWSVPATMAAAAFLVCMPSVCFGLFFVLFMNQFGATREEAAWPENVFALASHLSGFAMGLFLTSSGIYIFLHFDKYRNTAISLMYGVGWGVAGMTGQLVLSRLVDKYGFQGALLLFGGIMMHSIPIVMLAKNLSLMSIGCKWRKSAPVDNQKSGPHVARNQGNVTNQGNAERLQEKQPITKSPPLESSSLRHTLGLFIMPSFYVLVAVTIIDDYSSVQFSTTIVDYAIDKGIALDTAKTLISFSALGALIGRVAVPFIADILPRIHNPLYVLGFLLVSAAMFAMPHVPAYAGVVGLTMMHGICKGTLLCFRAVFSAGLLGVDRMAASCGVTGVTMIPLSLVSPMILGFYRDGRGTYDRFYRMLAVVNLVAALVFGVFSVWNRRR